ncbi:glutaredoxin 3 [Pararhizobium sp.]|uniref:glutaredoxin 3 n=1 Tax=Pararhizobium sp. TaxID=1977563 RepID=UPI002723633D|nr:glutaredoxin 3 [Pararhizobium sp.]MDO9417907.1 glutaredoxin 3 [Pararhizobium sp.]
MASVVIYTRQFCGYCSAAKKLFETKGVSFTEHDATYAPDVRQEMVKRANGGSTFPQIFIGDTHVGGCDDVHALDRAGKLDELLAS